MARTETHYFHKKLVPWWLVGGDFCDWDASNMETDIPVKTSTGGPIEVYDPYRFFKPGLKTKPEKKIKHRNMSIDSEQKTEKAVLENWPQGHADRLGVQEKQIRAAVLRLDDLKHDISTTASAIREAYKDEVESWLSSRGPYNSVVVWRDCSTWVRYIARWAAGQKLAEVNL